MPNFAQDIKDTVDEPIEAIVIGEFGGNGWGIEQLKFGEELHPLIPWEMRGKILSPEVALPLLDYEYVVGYGELDCHAVYICTKTKVWWVNEHDGATSLAFVPRNPTEGYPEMNGGR